MHGSFGDASTRVLEDEPGMTIGVYQCRPESQGSIHIGSPDPFAPPKIRPNFLSQQIDCQALVGGIRLARQVGEADALARYRAYEMNPGPERQSDEELLDYARSTGATTYHVMGTCKMGAVDDPMAVVDQQCRVKGVQGLWIADSSVMPQVPRANANATAIMIGERVAEWAA